MMINLRYLWVLLLVVMFSGCATDRAVTFQSDINPLLQNKCHQCHLPPDGEGYVRIGLNMASYNSLLNGTKFGTIIIPGDSKRSVINKLVEGRAGESMRMPHGDAEKLTAEEIKVLRLWVNQGAQNN